MTETKPDKRERITGRLRQACDLMIWAMKPAKPSTGMTLRGP
jgi:hypothetical protein